MLPSACGLGQHFQDLGHSFSLYGPPSRPNNNYSTSPSWIWGDKITNERVAPVGYNHFISNKGEWNNCFSKFSNRVLPPIFISTILQSGKFVNLAHYFPCDVKLRILADSRSFLANQKARNAIVGAENLLITYIHFWQTGYLPSLAEFGKGSKGDKSHSYWLARFNRTVSFHFPRVLILISDRSVWHNGKRPLFHSKQYRCTGWVDLWLSCYM